MESPRTVNQPFNIDRLPPIVHRAIAELYSKHGLTWQEIEDLSGEAFGQAWDDTVEEDEEGNVSTKKTPFSVHPGRGFVPWNNLPLNVLELFPDMKLPKSSLHRWYKKRVLQVQEQMLEASARSREVAQAFAAAAVDGSNEAVLNAARDQLMVALSEDASSKGRMGAAKALIGLAEVMQKVRANDIKERKVAVDEQTLQMKLDLVKKKAGELIQAIEGGADGAQPATREEMLAKAKDIYGVA
jgi:hypothetical protein